MFTYVLVIWIRSNSYKLKLVYVHGKYATRHGIFDSYHLSCTTLFWADSYELRCLHYAAVFTYVLVIWIWSNSYELKLLYVHGKYATRHGIFDSHPFCPAQPCLDRFVRIEILLGSVSEHSFAQDWNFDMSVSTANRQIYKISTRTCVY